MEFKIAKNDTDEGKTDGIGHSISNFFLQKVWI